MITSEDVGLTDGTLLPLTTAAYTASQKIGMPESRIPLAHRAVASSLAPKSTRVYRGLDSAYAALQEPGAAGLPIPVVGHHSGVGSGASRAGRGGEASQRRLDLRL